MGNPKNIKLTKEQFEKLLTEEINSAIAEQRQLNENVLMDLFSAVTGPLLSWGQGQVARFILSSLQVPEGTFISDVIVSAAEQLTPTELLQVLSGEGGRCNVIAREVIEALQAAVIRELPQILGLDANHWLVEVIALILRQTLVQNSPFTQPIVQAICGTDFTNLSNSLRTHVEQTSATETQQPAAPVSSLT